MITPVPVDPELALVLQAVLKLGDAADEPFSLTVEEMIGDRPVAVEHRAVPGPEGAPDVMISIVKPTAARRDAPGLYNIHGGGMIVGSRLPNIAELAYWADRHGVVGVTVDYRLAPAAIRLR